MLVVLRAFSEVWSSQPLFDVAPVSEDERLASEWSLILSASDSGVGLPLVVHVDVQCTTTSSMLMRRLGTLSDPARVDLDNLVRAYAMGDASSIEWRVGRPGSISIRFHPEWDEFARQLVVLSQTFAAPLAVERSKQESVDKSHIPAFEYEEILAAASGVREDASLASGSCKWEYREVAPFVYCHGLQSKNAPKRLGEAIAYYYARESRASGVCRAAPQRLDSDAFRRLEPLLNVLLTKLFEAPDARAALYEAVGAAIMNTLPRTDYAIIVESVRCAKKVTGFTAGTQPMRLAARRSWNE
jgi:hypothetical protein